MNTPLRPVVTACLLAGVTLLLYGYQLTGTPSGQEAQILAQARSGSGPMFFRVADDQWLQPFAVYATTVMRSFGGGEASARLATVVVAAVNVGLAFLCARLVFEGSLAVLAAPLLLLATPAHIAYARSGTDAIASVPFVLLWLLALLHFGKFDRPIAVLMAGAALGAGVYSNRAAPLTMGFLLLLSVAALVAGGRRWRYAVQILVGFGLLLMPAGAWYAIHPDTYAETFGRWAIHLAHIRNPIDGVLAFVNRTTLGNRVSLYWGFFDPSWLFFGDRLVIVLLPLLLLGLGMWRRVMTRHSMLLIAGGFVAAPLAGSSYGAPHYMADALTVVPFAALLAAAGVAAMHRRRSPL